MIAEDADQQSDQYYAEGQRCVTHDTEEELDSGQERSAAMFIHHYGFNRTIVNTIPVAPNTWHNRRSAATIDKMLRYCASG